MPAAAALLLLAACPRTADERVDALPELEEPPGATAQERCRAFYDDALLVEADTREGFRAALGEPSQIEREAVPNRHVPDVTDTLSVLRYDGLDAHVHTAMSRDLLSSVAVRDNRFLRYGLIGSRESRLLDLFGEPYARTRNQLTYLCAPEPMPDMPITFIIDLGRVAEIRFDYYVD